ncbi:MAG: radical SAM protein [Candidatus Omnitrophica bacterium]|nr:radical SAM protein [Candidatus Omnitrophota bacterium]
MKVLLVSPNVELINMPVLPLGLGCVASAVQQAGHEVKFLDLLFQEDWLSFLHDQIDAFPPDVIGITIRNIDDQNRSDPVFFLDRVKKILQFCRESSSAPIVLGGAGFSLFPESALDYLEADMGIQGEGEAAFPILLERLQNKRPLSDVPGLYLPHAGLQSRRQFSQTLNSFPYPPADLWASSQTGDLWLPFQTRRGCPFDCSYCSTGAIEGRKPRKRAADKAVQDVIRYREAGFRRFFFVDNTFNFPPSYAEELCQCMIDHNLDVEWRCILYPWRVSPTLIRKMARAGCVEVSLGFESGCNRILRSMNKRFTAFDVREISHRLHEAGIRQTGFLLLGGPDETKESVEESFSFVDALPLDMVKITTGIRIYPGTALARRAVEDGVIMENNDLLFPAFYLNRDLQEWLPEASRRWGAERPSWIL